MEEESWEVQKDSWSCEVRYLKKFNHEEVDHKKWFWGAFRATKKPSRGRSSGLPLLNWSILFTDDTKKLLSPRKAHFCNESVTIRQTKICSSQNLNLSFFLRKTVSIFKMSVAKSKFKLIIIKSENWVTTLLLIFIFLFFYSKTRVIPAEIGLNFWKYTQNKQNGQIRSF